ncbi:MAG: MarR family transcriptional regulator [Acidimicrobiales bacterium]|nr:MarR family transcriptional regulator [Acidimicrobiales bacterium]
MEAETTLASVGAGAEAGTGLVAFGRVAARLARQVEVGLTKVDLSLPQYRIMSFLDEGWTGASKLAEHLAVSRPTVTAVVDGLVARGLVARRHEDGDRRRVSHTLTPAGSQLLETADQIVDDRLNEIAAHLGDDEQAAQALRGLECWRRALDGYRVTKMMRKSPQ